MVQHRVNVLPAKCKAEELVYKLQCINAVDLF